jgi:error-prone DNA polymerase
MRLVKGLGQAEGEAVEQAVARHGAFGDIESFWRASGVRVASLRALASADAFRSMGLDRQAALWQIRALSDEEMPLFESGWHGQPSPLSGEGDHVPTSIRANSLLVPADVPSAAKRNTASAKQEGQQDVQSLDLDPDDPRSIQLPEIPPLARVMQDYSSTGLSLRPHPISFLRPHLDELKNVATAAELKDPSRLPTGRFTRIAGVPLVRQRPSTASGVVFMTIEDETGIANLIIRPDVYQRFRKAVLAKVVLVTGRVERSGDVVHVLVSGVQDISADLADLNRQAKNLYLTLGKARDFH